LQLKAARQEQLQVVGDADRLRRAFANLLSNAIKYSPDGGDVTVEATRENGSVTVAVSDHGVGIPDESKARIFDRFFRVDSSETRRIGGTGLGLALVREIMRAHEGEVGFDSIEGEGSRFWIKVPAA
ncbi:MAG: ATP-binding protein, partial [Solirubrobacteraceae bacterium]|nr:ATP-binding protein [Patulibacter sp.]